MRRRRISALLQSVGPPLIILRVEPEQFLVPRAVLQELGVVAVGILDGTVTPETLLQSIVVVPDGIAYPVILALDAEMVVGTARQVAVAVARLDDSLRYLDTRRYAVLFLLLNSQRRIGGDILFPRHLPLGQRIRRRAQNRGEQCQTHEQLHSHRIFR